jgi:predicted N-acyltransferase
MTELLLKLLGRVKSIIKRNPRISKADRELLEMWIQYAKENIEFSSQYLRHGFYQDIKKTIHRRVLLRIICPQRRMQAQLFLFQEQYTLIGALQSHTALLRL